MGAQIFALIFITVILMITKFAMKTDIPDFELELDQVSLQKARDLSPIQMTNSGGLFSDICVNKNLITSNDTSILDETAKWACPSEIEFENCPNFRLESINDKIVFKAISGKISDYTPEKVAHCAELAIKYATKEVSYVSKGKETEIKNQKAWNELAKKES